MCESLFSFHHVTGLGYQTQVGQQAPLPSDHLTSPTLNFWSCHYLLSPRNRCVLSYLIYVMLEINPKLSYKLGKHFTNRVISPDNIFFYVLTCLCVICEIYMHVFLFTLLKENLDHLYSSKYLRQSNSYKNVNNVFRTKKLGIRVPAV